MLGMFLGAVNQTIIAPAMPRIVAELGGMSHYSWIAVSSLLASTVVVPIVGKLSDLFGRKAFYVGGILVFMASSVVGGLAPTFEIFMVARVLEGLGMGTMMPLSQAIIGDIISPRERGKYQGLMGAVFGLASVVGPFFGGWITDGLGWRYLFFANIPLGVLALGFIIPFMHLPFEKRAHTIDYGGFVTLTLGLIAVLLAVTWGGTEYAWTSAVVVGLFAGGAAILALFVWIESRAAEPVLPLHLWRNSIFTSSLIANMAVAMSMFGAIYYIPVFVQGVLGASVTGSGAVLTPMMLAIVFVSTLTGYVITRTGHYKVPVLIGIVILGVGMFLLTRMNEATTYAAIVRNMIFIGFGLGAGMQTFVLIVQNAVGREDLGVATASTQLFRSIGASAGTAILGTILTSRMAAEMERTLSPEALAMLNEGGAQAAGAGALLNPQLMSHLPPEVLTIMREALAAALHPVFVAALPFVAIAFVAALFIREIPLRRTVGPEPEHAGRELLAEMNQAGESDAAPVIGNLNPGYRERSTFLGALFRQILSMDLDHLGPEAAALLQQFGRGDVAAGRRRLLGLAEALLRECDECDDHSLDSLDARAALDRVIAERPSGLPDRLDSLLVQADLPPREVLTPPDVDALERVGIILSVALLMDRAERLGGD